jgi:hypothetical protein
MRKFRFIGDSSDWEWDVNPIKRGIYSMELLNKMRGGDPVDDDLVDCKWGKENFEEVFEEKKETNSLSIENHIAQIVGYAKSRGMTVEIIFKSDSK